MEDLKKIEAIKQLKARYFRLMDTKQWDAWREVFTEDVTVQVGSESTTWGRDQPPPAEWRGRDEFVTGVRERIHDSITVHHGHMPEIELTSATTAKGIWAMEDIVESATSVMQGHGHYYETYELADGRWRIKSLSLTRLRRNVIMRTKPNG